MGKVSILGLPPRGNRFNQGGQVTQISGGGSNTGRQVLEVTIINVPHESLVDDYMASSNGKARLLNVISNSPSQFKQSLEIN